MIPAVVVEDLAVGVPVEVLAVVVGDPVVVVVEVGDLMVVVVVVEVVGMVDQKGIWITFHSPSKILVT
jgi:hypothetical protein